jgi:DNA-directed RNA polymerase specialized sigma24 family protein
MKRFLTNEDLFEALKADNDHAKTQLYYEIFPGLCNCSFKIVKEKEQAHTIATDRFWKCLARIREMKDYDHLVKTLFTATRNLSLNYIRDKGDWNNRHLDPIHLETVPDNDTLNEIAANEVEAFVRKLIDRYTNEDHKMAQKAILEGWKAKDIATLLQLDKKRVENKITRIKAELRDALRKAGFRIFF